MTALKLQFLGPWRVILPDGSIADFKYDKVRALLAYLAVEARRAHQRESLATLLWPELPRDAALNNLRQALHTLRQVSGDRGGDGDRGAATPYIIATRTTVQFNTDAGYHLDVAQFLEAITFSQQHAHRNAHSCQTCAARLQQAITLFRGPFLTDLSLPDSIPFEEWALLQREHLSAQMLQALQHLLVFHQRRGDYDQAAILATRQLAIEPWREQAHRALMRLHVLRDQRAAALAQYNTCRQLLRDELGVDPEERTTQLYRKIRDGLDANAPQPALVESLPERPFQVPLPATPFVGRQKELEDIARMLDDAACRLLTVTGPGGVGKTRLALQAAADQMNLFADGIYFLSLVSLEDASRLPELIAQTLSLEATSQSTSKDLDAATLAQALRDKELLLLLDNFEHLVEQALVLEPLLRLPNLNLLVTSRQPLNLQAEWVYPLSGFTVPASAKPAPASTPPHGDALQLFVAAARRAGGHLQTSPADMAHVARICRLLDGLPLGIELAAGWTRTLSTAEIAAEIERGVQFLTTRQRDTPQRHHSLWAVLSQSWQLLSPHEQDSLARLSVFQCPFTRSAAEAVAGADLSLLSALVDKSMLQRRPPHGYALHPLPQQYALQQLREMGAEHQARARHLDHYLQQAENSAAADERSQPRHMQQLAAAYDDLRAALRWARQNGSVEKGLRLASALYRFWYWRSHFREGSAWLSTMLEAGDDFPPRLHADALYAHGVLLVQQDRHAEALYNLHLSLSLRRELHDRPGQAACLNSLGIIAWRQDAYEQAAKLLEESLSLRRELGETNLGPPLNNLGLVELAQDHFERAESYFTELLRQERVRGQDMGVAISLGNLALAVLQQGRLDEALDYLLESISLFQKLQDREGLAGCLESAAAIAVARDAPAMAARLCAAAAALRQHIHVPLTSAERRRFDQTVSAAQSALGPSSFDRAWAEGAAMPLQQVLRLFTSQPD